MTSRSLFSSVSTRAVALLCLLVAHAAWALAGCASALPVRSSSPDQKAVPVDAPTTTADTAALEAHFEALLNTQADDWTQGNLEAFCAVYAEDAVFISPSGKTVGRQAIFDRYTRRYRENGADMGALTLTVEDIRVSPAGDMAAITLRWSLTWQDKEPASGLSLITLLRTPSRDAPTGGWKIVQDASM